MIIAEATTINAFSQYEKIKILYQTKALSGLGLLL